MFRTPRLFAIYSTIVLLSLPFFSLRGDAKTALVIGNSQYRHATTLRNPKNDAQKMAETLRRLGFDVIEGIDLTKAQTDELIKTYAGPCKKTPRQGILLRRSCPSGGRPELSGADRRGASERRLA